MAETTPRAGLLKQLDRLLPLGLVGYLLVVLPSTAGRNWVGHDLGMLGLNAGRALQGWPHLDFADTYTGGLSLLHAAAFGLVGPTAWALRGTLWLATLGSMGVIWWLLRRRLRPAWAALVGLLCVVVGVQRYFESMPSWYNLFLGIGATAALVRHQRDPRWRWLGLAGLLAGCSILIKSSGLFMVQAGMLALADREQRRYAALRAQADPASTDGSRLVFGFKALALLAFVASLGRLVAARSEPVDLYHFVLPGAMLAFALLRREWRTPGGGVERLRQLVALEAAFLLGVALPLLLWGGLYALLGGLAELRHGLFVAPLARLDIANRPMPPARAILAALPVGGLLLWQALAPRARPGLARIGAGLLAVMGLLVAGLGFQSPDAYLVGLDSSVVLLPVALVCALVWNERLGVDEAGEQYTLWCAASLLALIQFPLFDPTYSAYALPVLVLALACLGPLVVARGRSAWPWAATLGVYLVLGLSTWATGDVRVSAAQWRSSSRQAALAVAPARGLAAWPGEDATYDGLVADIDAHSPPGAPIWAGPDAPEVYFFSQRPTLMRNAYEAFAPPEERGMAVAERIEEAGVRVIVLKATAPHSALPPELQGWLLERFPHSRDWPRYQVRWR